VRPGIVVLLMTVGAGACAARAADPPAIIIDRSACSRCSMLISEPSYAAAMVWQGGEERLFDDIGCLVDTARELAPLGPDVRYWFHDDSDGKWIEGAEPVFVVSPTLKTPMGGGIVAYRDRATAERVASQLAGRVVSNITELLEEKRGNR
jgi:copper chaperone NosL